MWKRSITLRLTLLFAAGSAVVLLAVGYTIGLALERHFEQQDLVQMGPKLEFVLNLAAKLETRQQLEVLPARLRESFAGHNDLSVVIASADGTTLAGTGNLRYPSALLRTGFRTDRPAKWSEGGLVFRGIAAAASTRMPDMPSVLVGLVMNIGPHEEFMQVFQHDLWIAVGVSILIAAVLGWISARRGLAPVRGMAMLAQGITASRLKERLPPESVPVELAELAEAFNAMLARLEDSFERLSDFSSDLAHEIRTPVASLMTQAQVSLSRLRSAEEYREVLFSILEELDRVARMVSDMLYLAKADKGLIVLSHETVDLKDEVLQLFDFYGALVQEQGVQLELKGEATVSGDRLMIRRAISNLLSNAIRHTPAQGSVSVVVASAGGETRVDVSNTGSEIPPEQLTRLFERFYRVNGIHADSEGAGLGLAITKAIVQTHGGGISATSERGSTVFRMTFPAGRAP